MTRSLAFLALTACGGGAFALETPDGGPSEELDVQQDAQSVIGQTMSAPDVGRDVQWIVPDGATAHESWHETAQLAQDGALDVAQDGAESATTGESPEDAAPDAKPSNTCTPFPLPYLQFGSCTGPIDQPTYFVTVAGPRGCENRVTPIVCTCQETYNCDCILKQAPDVCGGARFVHSCGYAGGPGGSTAGIAVQCN